MRPSIKAGLIAGLIGLVLVFIGSAFSGICASVIQLLISGIAGYSSAQPGKNLSKGSGAREGAIAGAISAGIASHAPILVQVIMSALIRNSPAYNGIYIGSSSFNTTEWFFFYLIGLVLAITIGGIIGAIAGYMGTSNKPGAPSSPME